VGEYLNKNHKNIQFWVGISSTNLNESIELGKAAEKNNATYLVAALQTYYPLDKEHIYKFYNGIADNLNLPIFAYNFPRFTNIDLTPEILVDLANSNSIVGVKETGISLQVLKDLIEIVPKDFIVIQGADMQMNKSIDIGINSAILSSGNYIPKLWVEFFESIWNNSIFAANFFVRLDEKHVDKKVESLKCYKSQLIRDGGKPEIIKMLARLRGSQIGSKYAECFEDIRYITN